MKIQIIFIISTKRMILEMIKYGTLGMRNIK